MQEPRKWFALCLIAAVLGACSSGEDEGPVEAAEAGDGVEPEGEPAGGDGPHLTIVDTTVEGNGFVVEFEVGNFNLDEESIGMSIVEGTGHWHYYLNGELVDMGEGDTVEQDGLEPGVHHVRMSLHNNDHSPLSPAVEEDLSIEVPAL